APQMACSSQIAPRLTPVERAHNPEVAGSNPAPAMEDFPDRLSGRSRSFWGRYECGAEGRREPERALWFVVGGGEVEGGEERAQLVGSCLLDRWSEVGQGVEECFDLLHGRRAGPGGAELCGSFVEGGAAGA